MFIVILINPNRLMKMVVHRLLHCMTGSFPIQISEFEQCNQIKFLKHAVDAALLILMFANFVGQKE